MSGSPYNRTEPREASLPGKFFPEAIRSAEKKDKQAQQAMSQIINILLVDDHKIVRAGLSQFIVAHDDLHVSAEAGSGDEAISWCGSRISTSSF